MKPKRLRAIALAEWRGLPERPLTPAPAKAIGDVIGKIMADFGLKDRLREDEVIRAWQEIVGEFVAKHSTPQKLKDGVLTVAVLQPTLRFEFDRVWKPEILAKLKARFGSRTVREVRFRVG